LKINRIVALFLGNVLIRVRVAFLSDYPLILSLLKHRDGTVFSNYFIQFIM